MLGFLVLFPYLKAHFERQKEGERDGGKERGEQRRKRESERERDVIRAHKSSIGSKVNFGELSQVHFHLCKGKRYPSFFLWFKSL